jgi:uncharacterized membrane protein
MYEIMLTLHVLSAVGIGFYLLLPFVTARLAGLKGEKLAGYAGPLVTMNRIGQYILIVTFLTGGAMLHEAPVSTAWWIIALLLVLILFALSGMMTKPLKGLAGGESKNTAALSGKVRTFSIIHAIVLILAVLLMLNPDFLR